MELVWGLPEVSLETGVYPCSMLLELSIDNRPLPVSDIAQALSLLQLPILPSLIR